MLVERDKISDETQNRKKLLVSSLITTVIVVMLLLSGPAHAVVVSIISGLDGEKIQQGESKTFTVNVTIEDRDQYVPIESMSLNVTGPVSKNWTFDPYSGSIISPTGDSNLTITVTDAPSASEYGYGYGYGYDRYGYGYNFGYGYGYGYNYGAGGTDITFSYNMTLDTTYLDVGSYTAEVHVNTGKSVKPRFSSTEAIFNVTPYTINLTTDTQGNISQTLNITSPRGNVTLTLQNGTNATYANGTTLEIIMINSTTALSTTESSALPSDNRVIGEIVELGPAGARFNPPIEIRFNYTEPLPSGVSEKSLRVKFYNSTTGSWETITDYTQNKTGNYITANISHFSTYTLTGRVSRETSGSSRSGGGGGGGASGVSSGEAFDNIERYETRDKYLYAGKEITYLFTTPEISVYEISVISTVNTDWITAKIELLKGTSTLVDTAPSGTVYKNINIWLGTSGFATPEHITDAAIRFRVETSWLDGAGIERDEISLLRWDGERWVRLPTTMLKEEEDYICYEAHTTSFSPFAIVANAIGSEPAERRPGEGVVPGEKGVSPTPEKTRKPPSTGKEETPGTPGFEFGFAGIAICLAYLLQRKR